MRSAAVYYRVSTDRQDLASQEKAVGDWLTSKNVLWEPTVYQDHGWSGKDTQRPGFQAMLAACREGRHDTIVVYRLDRFSRDATTALRILLELDAAGVAFISVSQPALNLGHDMPFRRTMLAAFAEIAQIERETIVARVKAGLVAAKARGVRLGPPAWTEALRGRAVALKGEGRTCREIAATLEISVGSAHKLIRGAS